MNINFEYHNVSASPRLEAMTTEKLNKLENKYDFIINADVYLKKENTSSPEKGMICEIRLDVPGPTIFTEESTGSFEASIAKVIKELGTQLQKKKEKLKSY